MRRSNLPYSAALFLAVVIAPRARAQQRPVPPAARIGPHAIELQLTDRWQHGRQQPRFTPFRTSRQWLFIDSVRESGAERTLWLSLDERRSDVRARIVARRDGQGQRIATSRRVRRDPLFSSADSAMLARKERFDDDGRLSLPAARVWEVVSPFHPARLRAGERWIDTIALAVDDEGSRQALTGLRVSALVGDTTVNGQRLWIVSDSATVQYDERAMKEERTLDTLVAVDRSASGIVRGRMLYDPALGLFRMRTDSATLVGSAILRYPDGRSFETPARYEGRRLWLGYDPSEYAKRRRALEAEQERTYSGGVVFSPISEVDRRLANGDTAVRDSLLQVWRQSQDPNERQGVYGRLTLLGGRDSAFTRRFDEMRIADGDTAFLFTVLRNRPYVDAHRYSGGVDSTTMTRLIALMASPGLLFAFGVDRDPFYEDLRQALLTTPPAVTRDTTRWPCTPAACSLLAQQWPTASEPRLRMLGLIARFVLEPRTWTDTLLQQARGAGFFDEARLLALGVGATWEAASKAPLPPVGSDWRAWIEWMNGENPAYTKRFAKVRPAVLGEGGPRVRFEESHATSIRFTQARTGRDIIGELKRQLATARSDSAILVYEYMLNGLGEHHPTAASVAAHLSSGSPARIALGADEVEALFEGAPATADSATATLLMDQLIHMTLAGGKPWRQLRTSGRGVLPEREAPGERTLLLADSLPPALRAKWAGRIPIITAGEWQRRSERTGGTLFTITSVARVGPFARLGIETEGRIERRPEQAPWLYYGGTTYYLMEMHGEWVIVGVRKWVT